MFVLTALIYTSSDWLCAFTFVFFRALWWSRNGDRVKHAAVFPSVIRIADTLHLITAGLLGEVHTVIHVITTVQPSILMQMTVVNLPHGGSRCVSMRNPGRCWGWRWWQVCSDGLNTSCSAHMESRPPHNPSPCRRPTLHGRHCGSHGSRVTVFHLSRPTTSASVCSSIT